MNIKKHLNSADIVVILGILAIIASLIFRQPAEKLISQIFFGTEVSYSVSIFDAPDEMFQNGSALYDSRGNSLGIVTDTKNDLSGTVITISTSGMRDETGIYIADSLFLASGLELEMHSEQGTYARGIVKKVQTQR